MNGVTENPKKSREKYVSMADFIISSHGQQTGRKFRLPSDCILHFYTPLGQELKNYVAYPLFNHLLCGCQGIPTNTVCGNEYTEDYYIWNGCFSPYYGYKEVNGIFRVNKRQALNDLVDADYNHYLLLSQIIQKRQVLGQPNNFHCLFCRT